MGAARWRRRLGHAATLTRLLPAYAALGVLKHFLPVQELARRAWRTGRGPRNPTRERRVVSAVCRLSRWSGRVDRDCLQRSLLLYRELSRLSADPLLVVGFRRGRRGVLGHAWVLADGRPVAEQAGELAQFDQFVAFGASGEPTSSPDRGSGASAGR